MSQQAYFQSLSERERQRVMEENAYTIEDGKYSKPLSEEELTECRVKLSDNSIKIHDLTEDFDAVKKQFKTDKEPFESSNKTLLHEIRTKMRIQPGRVYNIQNHPDGVMESYNELGEFLGSRRLRPEEKQGNILSMGKVADN